MKKIIRLCVIACFMLTFAPAVFGAEYVVKSGDTLSKVAKLTRHKVTELVLMNSIRNCKVIHPGERITYISADDKLRAKVWVEKRRTEFTTSDPNYEFLSLTLEDLEKNRISYFTGDKPGTFYFSILYYSKEQGKICRVAWKSTHTPHAGYGEWMTKEAATAWVAEGNRRADAKHWLECR
jgi:hypothetical protein